MLQEVVRRAKRAIAREEVATELARSLPRLGVMLDALYIALGYFVYHGLAGVFAMLALIALYEVVTILALIPYGIGALAQGLIMWLVIDPLVFSVTHTQPTWLVTTAFVTYIVIGTATRLLMTVKLKLNS
jgi:hypothetical protein